MPFPFQRSLTLVIGFAIVAGCATTPMPTSGSGTRSGVERVHFDASVRPQDDFYRHVNGGWLTSTPIPADRPQIGSFVTATERAQEQLRALIQALPAARAHNSSAADGGRPTSDDARGVAVQQVRDYYASYMNEATLEQRAMRPLRDLLRDIDALDSADAMRGFLGRAQPLPMRTPLGVYVGVDAKRSDRYVVYLAQSGLGLPDRDYYLREDAESARLRAAYRGYAERLLTLAGRPDAAAEATAVLAFETQLARAHWTRTDARDPLKTYNPHTPTTLATLAPRLDWTTVAANAGLPADGDIVVRQPSYATAVGQLLDTTPVPTLRAYFAFAAIDAAAPLLHAAAVDAQFQFRGRELQGLQAQEPRWRRALAAVDYGVGDALGQLYVEKHFDARAKARVETLVAAITQAFAEGVDELGWMSEPTRREAKAKLAKLRTKIGYPSRWLDTSALYVRADDLYGNVTRAARFHYFRDVARLGEPVDREEWFMTPQTVNAYYSATLNEIVFTAAILQPPFFDAANEDAINFGAIGAVIGHEISHAFDHQGRRYDGDGNLRDWWRAEDSRRFDALAQQLVRQYGAFSPVAGATINGQLTLGENIADLSGLAVAYRAWQRSLGGRPAPIIDGTTGAQRFFIGWAQVWRIKYRDEALRTMLAVNPHSPGAYRVTGVLRNFAPFYEAYGLRSADGMFLPPEQRVRIW